LSFGAALAAAVLLVSAPVVAAVVVPNVICQLKGNPTHAPGAKATATLKLVNNQPTFTITGDTFGQFKNHTLTLEIVRGKTKLLLTRVKVDAAQNISRTLRVPGTTVRVDDVLQLTYDNKLVASGLVRQGRP
jgi:hypothetical protein